MGRWALAALAATAVAAGGWAARGPLGEAAAWTSAQARDAASVVGGWATRLRGVAATVPEAEIEERTGAPSSYSTLVVLGTMPGDCAFALAAVSPEGTVALTVLPATLRAVVPGYGEFTLADSLAFEGPELAALTVTNELGVRLDEVLPVARGRLAAALPPAVEVDLPVPLFATREGAVTQVLGTGRQEVSSADIETLLVEVGAGDSLEWLQRQGAAWRAVLAAVAADPAVADRLGAVLPGGGGRVADLLLAVATAEDPFLGAVPVESVAAADGDVLALSASAIVEFVPSRLGHLVLRPEPRPRVEVLNGNGRIGATRLVAEALVRHGFRLVRTDNADRFDYATTVVIAQGEGARDAAREAAGIVGAPAVYLEEAAPSPALEVSIIVGLDIPAGEA